MTIFDALFLGLVQGLTEFLPVSSSGHLILAREIFGLMGDGGLAFDAVLHFATALAIVVYFRHDVLRLIKTAINMVRGRAQQEDAGMVVAIVVATIPAVVLGLFLEDLMATLFRNPLLVAGTLILGSIIMICAETLQGRLAAWASRRGLQTPWLRGLVVGLFQSLALVPGMSRSGMAISGGMLFGLGREDAARFAFLIGAPLLLGAGLKKIIDIAQVGSDVHTGTLLIGAVTAFLVGLAVIHYLLRFLRSNSLYIFVYYRIALALLVLVVFW